MKLIKNTSRLTEIITTFARYGFSPWIDKIKLSKYIDSHHPSISTSELAKIPLPDRLKFAFETLGPTFVKFGQILASRSDLLPESFIDAFGRLHDQVTPQPFERIQQVLAKELGNKINDFESIDPLCLGSASVAQVHRARLKDGSRLVLKIQKPEVVETIREDLDLLAFVAQLLHRHVEELKSLNLPDLVDEFAQALAQETIFFLEANNIRKFKNLFPSENPYQLKIANVYWNYTTHKVLALEEIEGWPLSHPQAAAPSEGRDQLAAAILRNYLTQVFVHGFFHGDLHPGNVLILPHGGWALIDFGVAGRLGLKTKMAIIKMLRALAQEDYYQLANEYVFLSPYSDRLVPDRFAEGLARTISPYYGLNLNNINTGSLLLKTARLAYQEGLQIPRELLLFFKSLVGIESIIRRLSPQFDFLSEALQFVQSLDHQVITQEEWKKHLFLLAQESEHLIKELPRQIHLYLKKITSAHYEEKAGGSGFQAIENGLRKIALAIFWGTALLSISILTGLLLVFSKDLPPNLIFMLTLGITAVFIYGYFKI